MANILMFAKPGWGHFVPAIGIAKELIKRNHSVWIVSEENARHLVKSTQIHFISIEWIYELYQAVNKLQEYHDMVKSLDVKFDMFFCETGTGMTFIAEMLDIPYVTYQTYIPYFDNYFLQDPKHLKKAAQYFENHVNDCRAKFNLPPYDFSACPSSLLGKSPYLHFKMMQDNLDIYKEEGSSPQDVTVGLCTFVDEEFDSPELDIKGGPVILVCTPSAQEFKDQTLIYIHAVINAFGNKPYQILITAEPFYEKPTHLPSNVVWIDKVPVHDRLMPYADVVVTHGGLGTLQKTISHGIPLLIIPLGFDHHRTSSIFEKYGAVIVLQSEQVNEEYMKESILTLLEYSEYRENARKYQKAVGDVSTSEKCADMIEALLLQPLR